MPPIKRSENREKGLFRSLHTDGQNVLRRFVIAFFTGQGDLFEAVCAIRLEDETGHSLDPIAGPHEAAGSGVDAMSTTCLPDACDAHRPLLHPKRAEIDALMTATLGDDDLTLACHGVRYVRFRQLAGLNLEGGFRRQGQGSQAGKSERHRQFH